LNGSSNKGGAACRDISSPIVLSKTNPKIREKQEAEFGKEDMKHLRAKKKEEEK